MIKLIVAMDLNGLIGLDGKIPWSKPADLKRFRSQTINGTIIMGRKTFDSIGKPLPKRHNILITRNTNYQNSFPETLQIAFSVEEAVRQALGRGHANIWIIGGAEIYKKAFGWADTLDITIIDEQISIPEKNKDQAVYFPSIPKEFEFVSSETNPEDTSLKHMIFKRK